MPKRMTEHVIEELITAASGAQPESRARHILAQALYGLVRLARAEQLLEIRQDSDHAAGSMASIARRRQTRAMLRKIRMDVSKCQQELESDCRNALERDDQECPGCKDGPLKPV